MNISVLGSGSGGNSILVRGDNTNLLIDAGFSARQLEHRLNILNSSLKQLDAIVVTHEHGDHIKGLRVLSKKNNIPIFVSSKIANLPVLGEVKNLKEFETGNSFIIDDFEIHPFSVPHDALDPVGFTITDGNKKLGLATDCGVVTTLMRQKMERCDIIILEFNYDRKMLLDGPYPWYLKQRIIGNKGHLSNSESAELLQHLLHDNLDELFMVHVSKTNNKYDIPYRTAMKVLKNHPEVKVNVCKQDEPLH